MPQPHPAQPIIDLINSLPDNLTEKDYDHFERVGELVVAIYSHLNEHVYNPHQRSLLEKGGKEVVGPIAIGGDDIAPFYEGLIGDYLSKMPKKQAMKLCNKMSLLLDKFSAPGRAKDYSQYSSCLMHIYTGFESFRSPQNMEGPDPTEPIKKDLNDPAFLNTLEKELKSSLVVVKAIEKTVRDIRDLRTKLATDPQADQLFEEIPEHHMIVKGGGKLKSNEQYLKELIGHRDKLKFYASGKFPKFRTDLQSSLTKLAESKDIKSDPDLSKMLKTCIDGLGKNVDKSIKDVFASVSNIKLDLLNANTVSYAQKELLETVKAVYQAHKVPLPPEIITATTSHPATMLFSAGSSRKPPAQTAAKVDEPKKSVAQTAAKNVDETKKWVPAKKPKH